MKTNEQILNTITTNIREVLKLRGMTEKEFCETIGVSDRYFLAKRDDIGITRLLLIAETLKIRPENLWDEDYLVEVRREALKGEIERLKAELQGLEPIMAKPE